MALALTLRPTNAWCSNNVSIICCLTRMVSTMSVSNLIERPEFVREIRSDTATIVQQPLSLAAQIWHIAVIRKTLLLMVLVAFWEFYARQLANPLLFPTFGA